MVLGLDVSSIGLGNVDFSTIGKILGNLVGGLLLFLFVGVGSYFLWKYLNNKKVWNKKIFWFEEINGNVVPIDNDVATELTIPGTNISVFYIKRKNMYLPRPVIKMGKDSYWFMIRNNREIVNFRMKNMNDEMTEANLDYDHTDMRYSLTNLSELIKRNYKDKSKPWYIEYKEVISLVILVFVITLSIVYIISRVGVLINSTAVLIERADSLVKAAESIRGSGISPA